MCGLVSAQLRVGYFGVYVSSENGYQFFVFRRRLPSHLHTFEYDCRCEHDGRPYTLLRIELHHVWGSCEYYIMTGNSECDLFPREPVSGTTVLNFQIQDNCFTHYTVVGSLSFLHCPLCATVQLCSFSDPKCHSYSVG